MLLALACAAGATIGYGVGTVLQAVGARRASTSLYLDVKLFGRLARQAPYVGGLILDGAAFIAALVALRSLPLFVVQAAVAASVGVTALVMVRVFGFHLTRTDVLALVGLALGLSLLAASARVGAGSHLNQNSGWVLLAGVPIVAVAGIVAARNHNHVRAALGLAACAGLGFAGTAIAERALHVPSPAWHVAFDPVAIALVLYGACGMLMFASALQRGAVTATAAVMFAIETVVPALVGIAVLGDRTRPHLAPLAVIGFVLALGASVSLARYAEPERSHPEPPAEASESRPSSQ